MEIRTSRKEFDHVKTRQGHKIPGYAGHIPRFDDTGYTFGNATSNRFIENERENSSTSREDSLFRRTYSEPAGVSVHHLKKSKDDTPSSSRPASARSVKLPYALSHTGKRRDEIFRYNEMSQEHRKHYQDLTGTVHQVPTFTHRRVYSAPPSRSHLAVSPAQEDGDFEGPSQSAPHNKMVSFVRYSKIPQKEVRHQKYIQKQPSAIEKRTRDIYFERR